VTAITTSDTTQPVTGPSTAPTSGQAAANYRFALAAAEMAAGTRCTNVIVLDLRGRSPVTEYFIIGTGSSAVQMRTVAAELEDLGSRMGFQKYHASGSEGARWIVVDFVHVVAHVFDAAARAFYDLEVLWGDAPRIDWRKELGLPAEAEVIAAHSEKSDISEEDLAESGEVSITETTLSITDTSIVVDVPDLTAGVAPRARELLVAPEPDAAHVPTAKPKKKSVRAAAKKPGAQPAKMAAKKLPKKAAKAPAKKMAKAKGAVKKASGKSAKKATGATKAVKKASKKPVKKPAAKMAAKKPPVKKAQTRRR
jgi:ribosome-associated protein